MSAPASAASSASSTKRTRPDPVELLWSELDLLEKSVTSDLRLAQRPTRVHREAALPSLRSVLGTQGWATHAAITASVEEMKQAHASEKGMNWSNDATVRLGTIEMLLDSQQQSQEKKKAREDTAKPTQVIHFLHIHLDNSTSDELVVVAVPLEGLDAFKRLFTKCADEDKAGCLSASCVIRRREVLDGYTGVVPSPDEMVVWTVPVYHYVDGEACILFA